MAHQVFISYSHIDNQIANALCNKLEDEGTKCWIAPRDIEPGKTWADEIAEALPKSKVMILILSESSNASKQVLREVEIAVHNNLIILPIRIEDIMPTGGMSYYLATMQWIDVKGDKIDSKISMISKKTRNILREFEDDEEEKQRKIELIEKQRIEQENLIKAQAAAKAAEELLKQQEQERLQQQQKELQEKQRIERERQAKARIDARIANKMYKLQEKEKLQQKQQELAETERQLKYEKTHESKKAAVEEKFPSMTNKTNTKKLIVILSSVVLVIAVGLTLFFLRDDLLKQEDKVTAVSSTKASITFTPSPEHIAIPSTPTPAVTAAPLPMYKPEDFDYDSNMVVEIPDTTLKAAIIATLEKIDKPINNQITVADMFNLRILWMAPPEIDTGSILFFMPYKDRLEGEALIFRLTDNIDNLEGIQYAYNLNELVIANNSLNDISHLSELENLEVLSLISLGVPYQINSLEDISGLKNLRVFEISNAPLNDINALGNLSNLTHLHLSWCQLEDVSALAQLSNLEFLAINDNKGLNDLSYLNGSPLIKNLESLMIQGNNINDLNFLSEANNLKDLSLYDENSLYDINDISVLAGLNNLKEIWVGTYTYNNNLETIDKLIENGCSVRIIDSP